jgi:cytochrome bd-type quinol oxidase subunit 2
VIDWSDSIYIIGIPIALVLTYLSWRSRPRRPWLTATLVTAVACGLIVLGSLLWPALVKSGDEPDTLRYARVVAGTVVVLVFVALTWRPVGKR